MVEPVSDYTILYVIIVVIIAIFLAWIFIWFLTAPPVVVCLNNNQCLYNQACNSGVCQQLPCSSTNECPGSQICVPSTLVPSADLNPVPGNGFCQLMNCTNSSQCASNEVCSSSGVCVPFGGSCQSNRDCNNVSLICISGTCQQCSSRNVCRNNEICDNGQCKSCSSSNSQPVIIPCNGHLESSSSTSSSSSTPSSGSSSTSSSSSTICPINQVCVADGGCCPGSGAASSQVACGRVCSTSTDCQGSACSYCVNQTCTCRKGQAMERCVNNNDCASGNCLLNTPQGDICAPTLTSTCLFSHGDGMTSNQNGVCPASTPFCVSGTCSTSSTGGECRSSRECGNGQYCVNFRCSPTGGLPGQVCTGNGDCLSGLTCQNSRCLPAQ